MASPERRIVFPGEEIAVAEEFVPGPGTYEQDGKVCAACLGIPTLDTQTFTASVAPLTKTPVRLSVGDEVLGVVSMIREHFAGVEVVARCDAPDRTLSGDTNGTLHVSRVSEDYVPDLESAYKIGDIVRAEVVGVDPSLQLATRQPQQGILKSTCPRCRGPMEVREGALFCPECEWKDTGKISTLFGTGTI